MSKHEPVRSTVILSFVIPSSFVLGASSLSWCFLQSGHLVTINHLLAGAKQGQEKQRTEATVAATKPSRLTQLFRGLFEAPLLERGQRREEHGAGQGFIQLPGGAAARVDLLPARHGVVRLAFVEQGQ